MTNTLNYLMTVALIPIIISVGCKKPKSPQPEDLNKHLFGIVYDANDGKQIQNCRIALYQTVNDGGLNNSYLKLAETYTDKNGNYSFNFKRSSEVSYAIEVVESPEGSIFTFFPTDIVVEKIHEKEIAVNLKATYLYYYGYINWQVIGDRGNERCYVTIDGGLETKVLQSESLTLRDRVFHRNLVHIKCRIENKNSIVKDTSYFEGALKRDTTFASIHF